MDNTAGVSDSAAARGAVMKRFALVVAGVALLGLSPVRSGHAEVNVNVNVGVPVVPAPMPPPFALNAPPEFIFPPALGIYVAVDIPYDIFFIGSTYYLYKDRQWHRAPYYNGPWRHVERHDLPPGLRKHKYERIRHYRDEEYRRYRADQHNYRGRHFKPDKEWKKEHKEEKRYEKERRKEEKRYDKKERKMEKKEHREHGKHDGRD